MINPLRLLHKEALMRPLLKKERTYLVLDLKEDNLKRELIGPKLLPQHLDKCQINRLKMLVLTLLIALTIQNRTIWLTRKEMQALEVMDPGSK
jgi:hypothetical protein